MELIQRSRLARGLLATGILATTALTLTTAWAAASPFFANAPRLSEQQLDALRGGFTTTSGLQISFGIERAVYINGDLITATALNVTAGLATAITADAQQRVASAIADSPLAAPVASTATSSATAESVTATAASATSAAVAATAPATTSTSAATTATTIPTSLGTLVSGNSSATTSGVSMQSSAAGGGLVLVQNGQGNVYQAGALDPTALGTIIQNTLNDQKIQNVTLINATVNSAEILRAQMMRESITSAVTGSLRR